jgi:hypothetical protein
MELPLIPAYASQVLARLRCSDRASHIMPMFDLMVEVEPYRSGFVRGRSTPEGTAQDWTAAQMRQLMAWTAVVHDRDE